MADAPDVPARRRDLLGDLAGWLDRVPPWAIGVGLLALALLVYWLPGSDRFYNHFVWQADAFLHGRAAIDWPVQPFDDSPGNAYFQDVYPITDAAGQPAGALLPFPPLPAIVLMPFVALWGLATDHRAVSVGLGAIDVAIAWWALGRLPVSRRVRLATTLFFAFGTVFWYAAQLGTTWFFAHVVAVTAALLAIGVALGGDRGADDAVRAPPSPGRVGGELVAAVRAPLQLVDRRQLVAGLLFGLACTARLTVVFGAPFFLFVGGGGTWLRRGVSAGLGAALPIALLLGYNVATTGQLVHPGYEYQYQLEARGYPSLNYHAEWSIEDLRYLPQNLGILFLSTPALAPDPLPTTLGTDGPACQPPDTSRGLFDTACPIAEPQAVGMSILLTSPAYLLLLPALRRRRSRLVVGALLAVVAIAFVNLLHFSQGWVQFGYRFSNDFVPFALPLVALGMARRGGVGVLGSGLVGLSILVNAWGVAWGNILGW
ncbi:MAG TPA: hypothetical protein VJ506_08180 [Candidatus Limnocylindrales bacterium]|nr:hypothetical protein [Candidatus Limnocylindrales bacterium]